MITLSVDGKAYTVEFRHVTKHQRVLNYQPALEPRYPITAITTCVVIGLTRRDEVEFVAIENAVCMQTDNFSRLQGRLRSLRKVLTRCGALKNQREQLWTEYQRVTGVPMANWTTLESRVLIRPPAKKATKVSDDEKARLIASGSLKRKVRLKKDAEAFLKEHPEFAQER